MHALWKKSVEEQTTFFSLNNSSRSRSLTVQFNFEYQQHSKLEVDKSHIEKGNMHLRAAHRRYLFDSSGASNILMLG